MNVLNLVSLLETASTMCYIDPAATSVLLSSITAIVIAIGASAIIFWRKVKKKVSKTLHIDPNAGKEVEEDLVVNDEEIEDDEVEDDEVEEEAPKAKSKAKSKK